MLPGIVARFHCTNRSDVYILAIACRKLIRRNRDFVIQVNTWHQIVSIGDPDGHPAIQLSPVEYHTDMIFWYEFWL
ncbi:hypothetical protein BVZ23_29105 [Klebsiella variicola]|nr:hypothetical protein BVZ23_29105 [Klebsiella variicola]OYD19484.1 hypothetical protein A8A09_09160 [Klebsiella variicola]